MQKRHKFKETDLSKEIKALLCRFFVDIKNQKISSDFGSIEYEVEDWLAENVEELETKKR